MKGHPDDAGRSDLRQSRLAAERALDEVLAESFPASDPPSWTPGVVRPAPVDPAGEEAVPHAPQSASAAVGVADVPRRLADERTFVESLRSLVAICGLVLLVPFAILLVGVPVALLVRGLIEGFRWLLPFVNP